MNRSLPNKITDAVSKSGKWPSYRGQAPLLSHQLSAGSTAGPSGTALHPK